ncbi:MAG TPA: GTPase [Sedimentisphaerales bacterium]|nr:GTPase [Sedimentisphaerales bacterium]
MSIFAAVMTGKGTGAISTVQVFGDSAEAVIKKVFKPAGTKPLKFKTGEILLGTITDGAEVIDQVTIGCEGPDTFAINCHGNPLIVEMIMQLLRRHGAALLTAEQLLKNLLTAQKSADTIAVEAKLAQPKARTLQGTKIIANQIDAGLTKKARGWLESIDEISLDKIKTEAIQILQKSQAAKLIIYGCTAVLTGPPNSGKSTLLNCLAGRQKAIVTDIKGTTRDWVSAKCQIGSLSVKLIDTAGLDEKLQSTQDIDESAQEKTVEILEGADIVLLVLDNSRPAEELDIRLLDKIAGKQIITVLNKSDLPAKFDTSRLPETLSNTVQISAKEGAGIESLSEKIIKTAGAADFDLREPVSFTSRQENMLKKLTNAKSKQQAAPIITELLKGHV